ncbi:MAG TPA: AraC family transcriptional regulator, partial [Chitinophaga sp.]
MKHLSIIIPEEAVPAAIVDPRYMFTAVNQFLEAQGETPLFKVQLVGLSREVRLINGIFSVHTDALIDEVKHTDLILIPALSGDMQRALEINQPFIPWIV